MQGLQYLAKILGVDERMLECMDGYMSKKTGRKNVLEKVIKENDKTIEAVLKLLDSTERSTGHVLSILRKAICDHEEQLMNFLKMIKGKDEFEKAAILAKKIAKVQKGFFLKKERAISILQQRPPENLLNCLKVKTVDEAINKHGIDEIFSALRFSESDEWMHKTFDVAYSSLTPADFEEREIEIKVLGTECREIAEKFIKKKHHNVSHLKELGVVFLNPVKENIPGKFLRDFALILHYFYEINFYSKLFRKYASYPDFAERLKSLLRGDIKEVYKAEEGEWLIVQRYLAKENPSDPRLALPRVNPESLHWSRGERDLTLFVTSESDLNLHLWNNLDWVGGIFQDGKEDVVSFDLEDNAMSLVSFMEGKKEEFFNYHQKEAMWTRIFIKYAGGEHKAEQLLIENFDKGIIKF